MLDRLRQHLRVQWRRTNGTAEPGVAVADGGTVVGLYICPQCDGTVIAEGMETCPGCGEPVRSVRTGRKLGMACDTQGYLGERHPIVSMIPPETGVRIPPWSRRPG